MLKYLVFLACVYVAYTLDLQDCNGDCGCGPCGPQPESQMPPDGDEDPIVRDTGEAFLDQRTVGLCAVQLSNTMLHSYIDGHPRLGMESPRCDKDGSFLGMQYKGSQAYCVSKDGTPIDGYSVPRWQTGTMNCQCARDMYTYMQSGLIGKLFNCEPNGNYPTPTTTATPIQ